VLQARFNLITADPDRMADTVGYIKSEIRPAVESLHGSMGMSLYANTEVGVAVLESFWASRAALIASEQITAPRRKDMVQRAMGTVCVERYWVPVFEREAPLDTGAGLRLTRMDVEGSRVEDAVAGYGDTAVPWLAETAGFCGALLLVDWNSGHSISETIWDSPKTLAASRSVAARVRVETVKSTGCVIRALEEYDLVFNTARIGGV
jgi:hypothetical protein